jgi:hypothetical protein
MNEADREAWRTSSRCESQNCVEARAEGATVAVRNSANPDVQVNFGHSAWRLFIAHLKRDG